jgi:HlyD family secretion protein
MAGESMADRERAAAVPGEGAAQTPREPAAGVEELPRPRRRSLSELIAAEDRRRRRRLALRWAALAAIPLLSAGAWLALRPRPVPLAARFRLQPVTQGEVVRSVHATGHVEAVTTVLVGAEISGRLATVEVDFNDRVKAGQVLARFDPSALKAQLAQARATLAAARASVEQARTDAEESQRRLVRAERLRAGQSASEAEYDAAVAAARVAEQRWRAAESQLAAQGAVLALAQTNLGHAVIRSPIDGVVVTRNVDPGQTVASVLQTPVLFTVAADLERMRVVAAVDEADIGDVSSRQRATFSVNAYPERLFEGIVTEVRNSPVVVQDVVTYGTVIEVDNHDLALKPGMTATVRIRTASAANVLRVPSLALHFTPPGERSSPTPAVWSVEAGALHRVEVQPGIDDGELVAIAPGALREGATVVVELTPAGRKAYGIGH